MHVSTSIVYAKKKNQLSPPVRELVERALSRNGSSRRREEEGAK
jgi:hypothetical protein